MRQFKSPERFALILRVLILGVTIQPAFLHARIMNPSRPKGVEKIEKHMATIQWNSPAGVSYCSAVRVAGCLVLAAHCLVGRFPDDEHRARFTKAIQVFSGSNPDRQWHNRRTARDFRVHPNFLTPPHMGFDIAVIRPHQLYAKEESLPFSALATTAPEKGDRLVISGYGPTQFAGRPGGIHSGEVEVVKAHTNRENAAIALLGAGAAMASVEFSPWIETRTYNEDGTLLSALRQGDSGGGAFRFVDDSVELVGVNSFFINKERGNSGHEKKALEKLGSAVNGLTSVSYHHKWLTQTFEDFGCGKWNHDALTQMAAAFRSGELPTQGSWEEKPTERGSKAIEAFEMAARAALGLKENVQVAVFPEAGLTRESGAVKVFRAATDGKRAEEIARFEYRDGFVRPGP